MKLRVAMIAIGIFLLMAGTIDDTLGIVLGLYPPDTAERVGFDLGKLALDALALWAIYRGIRPRQKTVSE